MGFHPDEILLSPTTSCNLLCPHCNVKRSKRDLSVKIAEKFLLDCMKNGINRLGFTGGEPFLARNFLYSITRFAVKEGFLFTRIVTNGVWYKDGKDLKQSLEKLFKAGYDGSICLSVDAYHEQNLRKLAVFIKTVQSIWRRPDMISVVYVTGKDPATKRKLSGLSKLLEGRLFNFRGRHPCIRSADLFIKIGKIDLSPIGRAARLKDPWGGQWFKEDRCKGPGNVFFVEPSGEVKPCCGYASGSAALSIGNIKKDSVSKITKNIRQNRLLCAIFDSGLSRIKTGLVKRGVRFPGDAGNNCFFCHYILTEVPRDTLLTSLERVSV
jgi:MoaA/NifB/PqqE/SkfB family radical SAM enzyme